MSDMRAVFTIASSVTALALVFGIMTAIPSLSDEYNVDSSSLGVTGHVALTLSDADGNIKSYIQTDNVTTDEASDCAGIALFGAAIGIPTPGAGCGIFATAAMGWDSTAALDDHVALFAEVTSARSPCTLLGVGSPGGDPSVTTVTCTFGPTVITAGDIGVGTAIDGTPGTGDSAGTVECADVAPVDTVQDSCEIHEIAVFDLVGVGAGNMYGRVTIPSLGFPGPPTNFAKAGDTYSGVYTTLIG